MNVRGSTRGNISAGGSDWKGSNSLNKVSYEPGSSALLVLQCADVHLVIGLRRPL